MCAANFIPPGNGACLGIYFKAENLNLHENTVLKCPLNEKFRFKNKQADKILGQNS